MFKMVLDIASIDYNSMIDFATQMSKEHPDALKEQGIKLPNKFQMMLFKKLPDESKTGAIAQIINAPESNTAACEALEQMLAQLCQARVLSLHADTEVENTLLRITAEIGHMNSELAIAKLFMPLAMVPDYPDILGDAYIPTMNAAQAMSAALNLPEDRRELAVLKIIKHAKNAMLTSFEMAAKSKGIHFHIQDLRFYVPR